MKKRAKKLVMLIQFILKVSYWILFKKQNNIKKTAIVFRVSKWKQPYIDAFLPEYKLMFVPSTQWTFLLTPLIKRNQNSVFIVWGVNEDEEVTKYSKTHNIPLYRIEDGFIRSNGLGSMHTAPYSICIDKTGMYFDSTKSCDLEEILNSYDFSSNPELLQRSKKGIDLLKKLGVSKYNHVEKKNIEEIYGPKGKKRVLVIGQVEDDASIKKGSNKRWTNNDLVHLASKENPDAEIIYKPHPDVLTGRRPMQSDPRKVTHIAKVIEEPLSLVDAFQTIDHVYTITSLSGFEALLRGISVTTLGAPFYSGWGLTDDRQKVSRRKRRLTIEELFAGAYILYPKYADPFTKKKLDLEEVIGKIASSVDRE
ncbi:capsular polysaccharide biosynthesis protein [Cytobacillus firmus]|nr:capsular polysaccharide biosynthesis protein [Cytobacillus firmus]